MKKKKIVVWRITQDRNGMYRYQIGEKGGKMENSPGYHTWDEARQSVEAEIEQTLDQYGHEHKVEIIDLSYTKEN